MREQIVGEVLTDFADSGWDGAAEALKPVLVALIPARLTPAVNHTIQIDKQNNGLKGSVQFSVPVSLAGVPGGSAVQTVFGTPTVYLAVQCSVRYYRSRKLTETSEVRLGYAQKPDWWNGEGVMVEWRRTFRPQSLRFPVHRVP